MEKRKEQESFMHGKIRKNKKESKENVLKEVKE